MYCIYTPFITKLLNSEPALDPSESPKSFSMCLATLHHCWSLASLLRGGVEQMGTTDLIRTAGAIKAGGNSPQLNLLNGLVEHGAEVLILGGAAPCETIF